jgi:hypothetical protein
VLALADSVDDGREPDRDVGGDWFLVLVHVSPRLMVDRKVWCRRGRS